MSASDPLLNELADEIKRQDEIHPSGFPADRDGIRLGLAALEDELQEAKAAHWAERRVEGWDHTREELIQVAAVALRTVRSITPETPGGTGG